MPHPFQNVLVPIHFMPKRDAAAGGEIELAADSRIALDLALAWGRALGSSLTLTHVFESADEDEQSDSGALPTCRQMLERQARCVRETGIDCQWEFEFGNPAEEIVNVADYGRFGLIVLGTRQHVGDGKLIGSTATQVMIKAKMPVLVARRPGDFRPCVLIATDLAETSDRILELGLVLARARGAEAHVVHACADPAVRDDEARLSTLRARMELQLANVLNGDEPFENINTSVEFGSAPNVIWSRAAHDHADVVVMGMAGRDGAERVLRINTAETVLQDLPCSLMTIR